VIVYLWVVWSNYQTLDKAAAYVGPTTTIVLMVMQSLIAIALAFLSTVTWLHSRAMAQRWESAFKAINPDRERLPQMSRSDWLRVPGRNLFRGAPKYVVDGGCHARTFTEIVDTFRPKKPERFTVAISEAVVDQVGQQITHEQLQDMTRQVCERGLDAAKQRMKEDGLEGEPRLLSFRATSNCEAGGFWKINGTWKFEVEPKKE
jgi:ribonucleotide reductase beta subunit family protein with ferritin-like domain